ncbi:MAG: SsrA-binding protein SmpB [Candidatus Dependentiae bacterium]|jgi:SsrA-binding protein|nr:SsrA-binding protein SmpB [Candidatus Dependentiae bacterium]
MAIGKLVTNNKKAYHDYDILSTIEAGIVLSGDEVKSLRAGTVNLTGSFATVHQGELYLINCHVSMYAKAANKKEEEETRRRRKLLLHRRELDRIIGDISKKGVTIVPLKIYFNERSRVKVELGISKHKKAEGKKLMLKERDIKRETQRELKRQ